MILPISLGKSLRQRSGDDARSPNKARRDRSAGRNGRDRSLSSSRSSNVDSRYCGYGAGVRICGNYEAKDFASLGRSSQERTERRVAEGRRAGSRSRSGERKANDRGRRRSLSVGRRGDGDGARHRSSSRPSRGSAASSSRANRGGRNSFRSASREKSNNTINRSNSQGCESGAETAGPPARRPRIRARRASQEDDNARLPKSTQAEMAGRQSSVDLPTLASNASGNSSPYHRVNSSSNNMENQPGPRPARGSPSRHSLNRERSQSDTRTSLHNALRDVKFNSPDANNAEPQRPRAMARQTSFSSSVVSAPPKQDPPSISSMSTKSSLATAAACCENFRTSSSTQSATRYRVPNRPDVIATLRAAAASKQGLSSTTSVDAISSLAVATEAASNSHVAARNSPSQNTANSARRPRRVTLHNADIGASKETEQSQVVLTQSHFNHVNNTLLTSHLNRSTDNASTSDHNASATDLSTASSSKSVRSAPNSINKAPDRNSLLLQRRSSDSNLANMEQRSSRRVSFKETTDTYYIAPRSAASTHEERVAKMKALVIATVERSSSLADRLACLASSDEEKREEDDFSSNTALGNVASQQDALLRSSLAGDIVPHNINDTDSFCCDARVHDEPCSVIEDDSIAESFMHTHQHNSSYQESKERSLVTGTPLYQLSVFCQPKSNPLPPVPPPPPRKSHQDHHSDSLTDSTECSSSQSTLNSDGNSDDHTLNTFDSFVDGNRHDKQPLTVKTQMPNYNRSSSMDNAAGQQLRSLPKRTSMPDLNKGSIVHRNFPPPPPPPPPRRTAVVRRLVPPPPPPRRN